MNSRLGSLGNKFAAQRANLQLGREWEVLTGWPRWGIIWFWHECLTDCLGPDGKGGKSCSKKMVSKTELFSGSHLRQVMKPHQGLVLAATCQLW